jgi:hypothetical protein
MLRLLTFTFISLSLLNFSVAYEACENEINVTIKKTKQGKNTVLSEEEWHTEYQSLAAQEPYAPSKLVLGYAYWIYTSEEEWAAKYKNSQDKKKHCFMGCRLAKSVSLSTATYLAWYKEYQDLTDCDAKTFFDLEDQVATIFGAEYGVSGAVADSEDCFNYCNANKP